jgi:hypothetical protein
VPVSHHYGCIFVHVPRTGGSSVEDALALTNESNTEDTTHLSGWIQSEALRQQGFVSPVLQHLTLREIGRLLPRETLTSYFKFAIVRNPWERLLSNYLFERNHYLHFHPRETEYLSLPDYIDQLNPFLRQPQTEFIRAGEVQLDYLGRFERLDEDFAQIAGCLRQPPGKLAHLNRTRHEHYSRYYCAEARRKVENLFAVDIETLGYRFEDV